MDLLKQEGRKASRRLHHAFAREVQAGSGRSGQRLRHRQGRQRRSPHRHDVHPGRSVRARVFAIANVGRRRRGWRRRRRSIRRRSRSAKRRSSPRPSNSRAIRTPRTAGHRHRQAAVSIPIHFARSGRLAFRSPAGSRADRRSEGHQRFPEGHDRRVGGHGAGRATIAAAEVEGRHSQRAEGSAIPAARRSHVPADSGCVWSARGWRRRGRRGARSGRSSSSSSSTPRRINTRPRKVPPPAPNKRREKSTTR